MRLTRFTVFAALLFAVTSIYAAAPIRIMVDATDAPRDVIHTHVVIPASPGPLNLF